MAGRNPTSLYGQQAAIGKALWHQVTTVVILRQNMRQHTKSVEDAQFHEALSNMCYKACTAMDIAFLKSRVSCNLPNRPSISDACFRNVLIITCLNSLKDEINRLGALRFAQESNKNLVDFFLIDLLHSEDVKDSMGRKQRVRQKHRNELSEHGKIKPTIQRILWEQPPCANTKLLPGKLSLCIGMPVMIRNNIVMELCITKGQEGFVYGWQSRSINGVNILDMLFIQLCDLPTPVKLDGLPLNVVPLAKNSVTTTCILPDDTSLDISHSQPDILLNFTMTDFASQGKMWGSNVVDLSYMWSHQGYYMSLSRSTSAAGTLILGGFHPSKITRGASGALRQEFWELELLDEITTLHYENKLPRNIAMADHRNTVIVLFREKKGSDYMLSKMHKAIRWNKHDPYLESDGSTSQEVKWRFVESISAKKIQLASESSVNAPKEQVLSSRGLKREHPVDANLPNACIKRLKDSHNVVSDANTHLSPYVFVPIGLQWQDNSCAYDAVCMVLFNIWCEDPAETTLSWNEIDNNILNSLTADFASHEDIYSGSASSSLDQIRDNLRHRLTSMDNEFAFGIYASVHAIMDRLLVSQEPVIKSVRRCHANHTVNGDERVSSSCEIILMTAGSELTGYSIQEYMDDFSVPLSTTCPECGNVLVHSFLFTCHPPLLCIELWQGLRLLDSVLHIDAGGLHHQYKLRGVIYFSDKHFTSRIITRNGMVWFHDGICTCNSLDYESPHMSSVPVLGSTLAVFT